jgi:DHA1 family tetracycline resistance protein-like MFS transporter
VAKKEDNKHSILPIFLVVLIDMIGIGIVIPVLAPLFINGNIIQGDFAFRTLILGLLIAAYPFAQFIGAPILGTLSDKYGRKKLLIISLTGTLIAYALFAIGILTNQLWLLFFSRILDGFTGGNVAIAMSSIADISNEKNKALRFGLIGMSFGLGIIIGPVIGGFLADPKILSWFNHSTPFWFAAILCFTNIILFMLLFKETLHVKRTSKISFIAGINNIKKAFSFPELRTVFAFTFLFSLGFGFYAQFFQVYLIQKFNYTESQIGLYFAFLGLCIALAQGFIVRPLSKRFKPEQIIPISAFFTPVFVALMMVPSQSYSLYIILPFLAIANGLTFPNNNALISNMSSYEHQGEILGISQSLQSLSQAIPPVLAGIAAGIYYKLPIIMSVVLTFSAWLVFIIFFHLKRKVKV